MSVKNENLEPVYLLAKHPKLVQLNWIHHASDCFKTLVKLPSGKQISPFLNIIPQDVDLQNNHTRFTFVSKQGLEGLSSEDQAFLAMNLRKHQFTESLQVAIYEEKVNQGAILALTGVNMKNHLEKNLFERLINSINLTDEVLKACDFIRICRPGLVYDPDRLILTLSVDADEKAAPSWIERVMEWSLDVETESHFGHVSRSLSKALSANVKNNGYANWIISQADEMNPRLANETIFKLKVFFDLHRICVGLEVLGEEDFRPYLRGSIYHSNPAATGLISHFVQPEPGDLILDLSTNSQDLMMDILSNNDYLFYTSLLVEERQYEPARWNRQRVRAHYEMTVGPWTHHHDFLHVGHWTNVMRFDDLMETVDKVILPITLADRPYTEDALLEIRHMNEDYARLLKLRRRLREGAQITLICPLSDMPYVDALCEADRNGLRIIPSRQSRYVDDQPKMVYVMEVVPINNHAPN